MRCHFDSTKSSNPLLTMFSHGSSMSTAQASEINPQTAPVRSCGTCTLCCKVYEVPPIDNKPRGVWCKHCTPGKGCGIWEARPEFCRDFHCLWIKDPNLGPDWKPEVSKFIMAWTAPDQLFISCDNSQPLAYQREPYFSALKDASKRYMAEDKMITVFSGPDRFILLPDGAHLLGRRGQEVDFDVARQLNGTYRVTVKSSTPV
jgi:hypothetical protein